MNCRGQMQLSFGMIFSIIMIIAGVAVAFYVITFFLDVSKCAQAGIFYQDLDNRVDKVWVSEKSSTVFESTIPPGITSVCFGNLTQFINPGSEERRENIERVYRHSKNNVFLYPTRDACGKEGGAFELKHGEAEKFFCAEVNDGKVQVKIKKDSFDKLAVLESV